MVGDHHTVRSCTLKGQSTREVENRCSGGRCSHWHPLREDLLSDSVDLASCLTPLHFREHAANPTPTKHTILCDIWKGSHITIASTDALHWVRLGEHFGTHCRGLQLPKFIGSLRPYGGTLYDFSKGNVNKHLFAPDRVTMTDQRKFHLSLS